MRAAGRPQLGEPELEVLRFAGEQRLFEAGHVRRLLAASASTADGCLEALCARRLLTRHDVFRGQPAAHSISTAGLRLLGSRLSAPRLDLSVYRHDIGVAWAWLAAREGRWGRPQSILSERTLRSRDRVIGPGADGAGDGADASAGDGADASAGAGADASAGAGTSAGHPDLPRSGSARLAVRLPGSGPAGRPRLHYPDLIVELQEGPRLAVELELSGKGSRRLTTILRAYVMEPRLDGVIYLVDQAGTARAVGRAARAAGASGLLHLEDFSWAARPGYDGIRPAWARTAARVPATEREGV